MKLALSLSVPQPPDERGYERDLTVAQLTVEMADHIAWRIYAEAIDAAAIPQETTDE